MISTQQKIYCINPDCTQPINRLGNRVCANCQTPLVQRYLWATGSLAAKIPPETNIANRYEVITEKIWLDTQPGLVPDVPEELPDEVIPYLKLYQKQLHIPQPYGLTRLEGSTSDILLLENVPIDQTGRIYPILADAWMQASAVRQVYWLWQILQLWSPLSDLGVANSLLILDNLRVQGWCVRLLELHPTPETLQPNLQDLGQSWQSWVVSAKISVAPELQNIVEQMCSAEVDFEEISNQLNALLLSAAAELPLNLEVAGATDTGPELTQNEDTCYPTGSSGNLDDPLIPRLSIVCDGIGGHQGGEVASQLAVQSLKLQIRALLAEVAEQTELVPPNLLEEQLEASLRVVNNVISARNDEQKRQGRERMATTLVMALQVPQRVESNSEKQLENAHELYIANVGDSRAYWITRHYCQRLTVDDDVAMREVRFARSLYRQALKRPDATALTQALGTKDAEALRLSIKRFIVEEDGILLLCSDGLSDNNWVEQSWQDYAVPVLTGKLALEDAVRNWINLANQKNGHDNTSLVMTHCSVSREYLVSMTHLQLPVEILESEPEEFSLADSSQVLLDLDITAETATSGVKKSSRGKRLSLIGGLLILLLGGAGLGLFAWWRLYPQGFQQMCGQLPDKVQQLCPPVK
ncbi:protein phosphatase 2C domain-containing protein [Calothrix sp. PCC 7507]|uniref:protein phosphatase 2C domain-containing protein n=1 Tax=Calothrix sp. PCC 7507 TaxID=99598 RepID=UPI00029F31F2|nr:protein phosphatase 2C domain-containing protein [Calothrix sp. PCC 7507]AFY34006.1 protein serine/threonine phosphatase [Calothrix sp. PCC 7507]